MAIISPLASANSYTYLPQSDFHYHQNRPYAEESTHYQPTSYNPHSLQKHPLWSEFWDAYNYKGPLEEEHARLPGGGQFLFTRDYHQKPYPQRYPHRPPVTGIQPVDYYPQRYPHRPPGTGVDAAIGDGYDRYRDYFFRRFGSNFNRDDPRY